MTAPTVSRLRALGFDVTLLTSLRDRRRRELVAPLHRAFVAHLVLARGLFGIELREWAARQGEGG